MNVRLMWKVSKGLILNHFDVGTPLFVGWALTEGCNAQCLYCSYRKRKPNELDTQQVKKLIDDMAPHTAVVNFTGGEPLLRSDIGTIMDYAKSKGLYVILSTNGILVPRNIEKILHADVVSLSLDGPKDIHDRIRGKGTYDSVIRAIHILKKYGMKIKLNCVISSENKENILEIVKLATRLKIKLYFQPADPLLYPDTLSQEIHLSREEYRTIMKSLKKLSRSNKYIGNSEYGLRYLYKFYLRDNPNCVSGRLYCRINSEGSLSPCGRTVSLRQSGKFIDVFRTQTRPMCASCNAVNIAELDGLSKFNSEFFKKAFGFV